MTQSPVHERRPAAENSLRSRRTVDFRFKYWALLVFAVLVAFGPLTLTNQLLWDDWVLIAHSQAGTLWELFKQAGRREQFLLMNPLAFAGGARACAIFVLLLFCVLAPLIYTIIRRATRWPAADAFWAALLTALVPLNQARFALATEPYAFSCVFFALALVVLLRDLARPSLGPRILTALLLMMAFSTNSFLVLSWIAPAIVAADAWRNTETLASVAQRAGVTLRALASRGELILLPPIYWFAKQTLEPTYGRLANYNKFQMGALTALMQTVRTFFSQFGADARVLLPRASDLPALTIVAALAIALFVAAARFWHVPLTTFDERSDRAASDGRALTLLVALALIVSALFPYVIVGQPPRFTGLWETRHQTTLMVVSGFAIFSVLRLVVPRRFLWKTAAVIAAGFLVIDLSTTHQLVVDALETGAVAELFKQQPSAPGTMIFVIENDRDYRALGRFFPFYEMTFLANTDQTGNPGMAMTNREVMDPITDTYPDRLIPAATAALIKLCQQNRSNPQFGFGGFVSNGTIETVRLVTNREPPGVLGAILEAIHADGAVEPTDKRPAMVRAERKIAPVEGACVAPCCSNQ
jgi:hypothetical protein